MTRPLTYSQTLRRGHSTHQWHIQIRLNKQIDSRMFCLQKQLRAIHSKRVFRCAMNGGWKNLWWNRERRPETNKKKSIANIIMNETWCRSSALKVNQSLWVVHFVLKDSGISGMCRITCLDVNDFEAAKEKERQTLLRAKMSLEEMGNGDLRDLIDGISIRRHLQPQTALYHDPISSFRLTAQKKVCSEHETGWKKFLLCLWCK